MKFVPGSTDAGAVFTRLTSATGVTVVVTGGVTLFVGTGSPVGEPTLAKFVIEPLAGEVTVTVRFVTWFEDKVAMLHVTTPLMFVPLPLALTNVTLLGIVSVTMTLLALDGPKFVTEIV